MGARRLLDDAAFGVVGITLLAPANGKAIELAAVHHEGNGLGGFAKRDRQAAGGQRIERAGVAGAPGGEQPLDHADGVRGGHADRLVEHHPAMHVAFVAFELFLPWRTRFSLPACGGGLGRGRGVTPIPPPDEHCSSTSPASGGGEANLWLGSSLIVALVVLFQIARDLR